MRRLSGDDGAGGVSDAAETVADVGAAADVEVEAEVAIIPDVAIDVAIDVGGVAVAVPAPLVGPEPDGAVDDAAVSAVEGAWRLRSAPTAAAMAASSNKSSPSLRKWRERRRLLGVGGAPLAEGDGGMPMDESEEEDEETAELDAEE